MTMGNTSATLKNAHFQHEESLECNDDLKSLAVMWEVPSVRNGNEQVSPTTIGKVPLQ